MKSSSKSPSWFSVVVLAWCLSLAGCVSLGDAEKITVYAPDMSIETNTDWPKVCWSLLVMQPTTGEMLDSRRIAVRPTPDVLQVYQGAVWTDALPRLLQAAVLKAFEDSGHVPSVARQGSGLRGDVNLLLDVRHFESVYASEKDLPVATIELHAKLVSQPGNKLLAAKTFRSEVQASDKKIPAVTTALAQAATQTISDVVGWTLANGPNAKRTSP